MLASTQTRSVLDRATFTITFERTLAADPERVFDAWTDPEQVTHWWDPSGTPLAKCTIDLRVSGSFEFVNRGDGHSPPFAGVYREITRPTKLVFDALGSVGTVLVEGRGSSTHLTVTIRCSSAEHLEQFVKIGVDAGTNQTLDNLVAYVEKSLRH